MASYGLLKGLGGGLKAVGEDISTRLREERLREYQSQMQQVQFDRQDTLRAEDHARADALRATDERTFREGGAQITEQYNAAGELVGRKEAPFEPKDPQRRFYMSGNTLYDAYNTDKDGNPITVQVGGGAGIDSQQVSAAKDIIRRYTDKMGELTPQEQSELDQAQQIILSAAKIKPGGLLQPEGRTIDQSRAWAEERVGKGWLKDYGPLKDRNTAVDYYTDYDQAVHRGEQGLSPAAWMAQRSGAGSGSSNNNSAPGGQPQGGSNNDPAAALEALRAGKPQPEKAQQQAGSDAGNAFRIEGERRNPIIDASRAVGRGISALGAGNEKVAARRTESARNLVAHYAKGFPASDAPNALARLRAIHADRAVSEDVRADALRIANHIKKQYESGR